MRYEDLVRDQIGEMRKLYERLELGEFETVLPQLEHYVAGIKDYKTNQYEIDYRSCAARSTRAGGSSCAAMATATEQRQRAKALKLPKP